MIPTDDDEDALAPVDDYEQAIDDTRAFRLCSDDDCREPRRGPFLIDMSGDDPAVLCYRCFATNALGIDPNEVEW